MTNHFPGVPSGMLLAGVSYQAKFPAIPVTVQSGPLLFSGVTSQISGAAAQADSGLSFQFSVPGNPGAFDQDSVEVTVARWLQATTLAAATATGGQAATVANAVQVVRLWSWVSPDATGTTGWRDTSWNWQAGLTWPP